MSQRLISRSDDLKRLQDEGYHVQVLDGFLIIRDVPYRRADGTVATGILVCSLALAGDQTAAPDDHTMRFAGELPHDTQGQPLTRIINSSESQTMAGVVTDHYFSSKPYPPRQYTDYHEKVTTYVAMLEGPAQAVDPEATAKTHPVIEDDEPDSVFRYMDNASSRADISAITEKLRLQRLAIVGLGGTGSYVLDLVAKTPVQEIHLIDGDTFLQHNAFRAPGAPSIDELRAKHNKVDYLAGRYEPMREGLIPHPEYISTENLSLLDNLDFAFLCIDASPVKQLIIEHLERTDTPFIDVGMGVQKRDDNLGGVLRTTLSTAELREAPRAEIGFVDFEEAADVYEANIQVADLNALNAALAVVRWKKHFGFYQDFDHEHTSLYTIDGNHLLNKGGSHED